MSKVKYVLEHWEVAGCLYTVDQFRSMVGYHEVIDYDGSAYWYSSQTQERERERMPSVHEVFDFRPEYDGVLWYGK